MSDVTQENRQIELLTPLGKDKLLLTGATIDESISGMFQIHLEMRCEDINLDFNTILGKQVSVKLTLPKEDKFRYFNGFVGHCRSHGIRDGLPYYTATAYPWLWFLTHTRDCRIFQNKAVPDIIKEIFDDLEFNDYELKLTGDYREWEYCVQYRESDYNFVNRLMEHEGIFYYFNHEEDRHIMVLADSNASLEPYEDFESIVFSPEDASGASIAGECVRSVFMEKQLHPGSVTHRDFDFKAPDKDLTATQAIDREHDHSFYEVYDYPGHYTESGDGEAYSRIRMEAFYTGFETVSGEADARGLAGGHYFDLTDHPIDGFNKRYLVISAAYHLTTTAGFQSGVSMAGPGYTVMFNAIDYETPYRPATKTPKPLVEGPQTAIVSGPGGDEIYTDEYGRVKVQFHWDREGQRDENSSCWIRVSQGWAGKKWGAMVLPRIGQEVIVEFLEGDPDQPIITGRVYNAKSMPPYALPAEKTKSTFKTDSSKGGSGFNEIRFEDKKGSEQLFFHAEKNMDMHVKNDSFENILGNRHQTIGEENGGSQKKLLHGDKHFRVVGDRIEKVESNDNLTVDADRKQEVTGSDNLTVGGDLLATIGADYHLSIGGTLHETTGSDCLIEASGTGALKAASIKLDATSGIEIKCGGSSVVIAQDGVYITGTMVYINSGSGSPVNASAASPSSAQSPALPEDPEPADNAEPGEPAEAAASSPADTSQQQTPAAAVLRQAAQDGTPFCEECERARQEQNEAAKSQ